MTLMWIGSGQYHWIVSVGLLWALSAHSLLTLASPILHEHPISSYEFPDTEQARFARSLESYHITIPSKVDHAGRFLSHQLPHHLDNHGRSRRDTDDVDDTVHYQLNLDGDSVHVTLEPNRKFLGPGMVFETRSGIHGNLSDYRIRLDSDNKCHFIGRIRNQTGSSVAITTCNGLHGMMRTNKGHYFIEPIRGHNVTSDPHHPHVVYKTSSLPAELYPKSTDNDQAQDGSCGVEDSYIISEKERDSWQKENVPHSTTSSRRRGKRSVSVERHVELLVVVDSRMMEYYKNEDIDTYILTIINMVSNIYHDASLGNAVNIVLVRVLKLLGPEPGLKINHHADHTLKSFCQWQTSVNPPDEQHPNHHDVAILITRYNICSRMNEPCSTLGLAQVSGLCQPHRSCNVNEDTGLALAFTVAHELGHNFDLRHDGTQNTCYPDGDDHQYVMSPLLNVGASPLYWSECSRQFITRFLDRDWGFCLDDEPSPHAFDFPEAPPGVMYDADHQCSLQYGPGATHCGYIDDLCRTLWCRTENKCLTRLEAAAVGTICGENKWCSGGRCVTIGDKPLAIDGQWGQWNRWTDCSVTCGAGVSLSDRHCEHPPPQNGGKYCLGERKRYRICNVDPCPEGEASLREVQCSEFNQIAYRGRYLEWDVLPKIDPLSVCQLHCKPRGKFFSVMLRETVIDGTPCRLGSRDMCITGRCRHVGCDWKIDSQAVEDHCGVCHGDGSSCKMVKKEFNDKYGLGYVEAMVIPAGARNIRVEEVAEANNYLALRSNDGHYFLNGGWFIQWSGDYKAAGTVVHYTRDGNKESFSAEGPLREPLHIMLLFQSNNPGVKVKYTVPNGNATDTRRPVFYWKYLDWTHCTSSCGGGYQRSEVVCVEKEAGIVENHYCNSSSKPDDMQKSCNTHTCPARWWMGPWQRCSVTCGNTGIHRRTVLCIRSLGPDNQMALDDHECEGLVKPSEVEPCHQKKACPRLTPEWLVGDWQQPCDDNPCSRQYREVTCSEADGGCDQVDVPDTERQCGHVSCGQWQLQEWSPCTRSCGMGIQFRSASCIGGLYCHEASKPMTRRECSHQPCPPATNSSTTTSNTDELFQKNQLTPVKDNLAESVHSDGTATDSTGDVSHPESTSHPSPSVGAQTPSPTKATSPNKLMSSHKDTNENGILRNKMSHGDDSINTVSSPMRSTGVWGVSSTTIPLPTRLDSLLSTSAVLRSSRPSERQADQAGVPTPPGDSTLYRWTPLLWEKCSKSCGSGLRRRRVACISVSSLLEVDEHLCDGLDKVSEEEACDEGECHDWHVSEWSQCSATCGDGARVREVTCHLDDLCDLDIRPASEQLCNLGPCLKWVTGPWGECSKSCGEGKQLRNVQCVNVYSQHSGSGCDPTMRPEPSQSCNLDPCPEDETGALESNYHCPGDQMSATMCRALLRMGRCSLSDIQHKCCRTCHNENAPPRPKLTRKFTS